MPITQGLLLTTAASLKVAMAYGLLAGGTSAATPRTEYHHCLLGQALQGSGVVSLTAGQRKKTMKLIARANHSLPPAKAKEKANELASSYGMSINWINETKGNGLLEYSGFTVPGEVQLETDKVLLSVEVPKAAFFFQKKIKNELEKKLSQAFNP